MEFPLEITIGSFTLNAHLVFETLAFLIGFRYYLYLRKPQKDLISSENRIWILIGATLGALLFSRLLGALENPEAWVNATHPLLYFFTNKTIVGGLFGGLFGVELIKYCINEKQSSGDLFTFPIILGMIIGRIGCFLNGMAEATYGIITTSPFGMDLGDGLLRHPVALYEIAFLIILGVVLSKIQQKYYFKSGTIFKLFMMNYFLFRFIIEFIKPHIDVFFNLSSIQIACIILFIYYRKTIYYIVFKKEQIYND